MKKKLFALLIMVAMLALVACSSDEGKKDKSGKKENATESTEDGEKVTSVDAFEWEVQGQCVAITGVTEKGAALKELVVPDEIDGKKVIAIEDKAFRYCSTVEEIALPDTIRYIGDMAISQCENLKKIKISDGLEYIGAHAFYEDKELVEINIPDSVIYIEDGAFALCKKMDKENILSDKLILMEDEGYFNYEILKKCEMPEYVANRFDIQPTDASHFYWEELEDGTISITGVKKELKEVNIPETINGKKVTCIDEFLCSWENSNATEVLIVPSGVVNVKSSGGTKLRCIKFCGNLESLVGFDESRDLEAVVVPNCKTMQAFSAYSNIVYAELPVEEMEELCIGVKRFGSFGYTAVPVLKLPKRVGLLDIHMGDSNGCATGMVIMPESVGEFDELNFGEGITIVVKEGSEVEAYLKDKGIEYVY